MAYIDDIDRLVEEGQIIPGDPEESRLLEVMVERSEPPRPHHQDAPVQLVERVGAFIAGLCSADDAECYDSR
jgi:hypothetical protein